MIQSFRWYDIDACIYPIPRYTRYHISMELLYGMCTVGTVESFTICVRCAPHFNRATISVARICLRIRIKEERKMVKLHPYIKTKCVEKLLGWTVNHFKGCVMKLSNQHCRLELECGFFLLFYAKWPESWMLYCLKRRHMQQTIYFLVFNA